MKSRILLFLTFGIAIYAKAQSPDIAFIQEDTLKLEHSNLDYYEVSLGDEPFTILFEGEALYVCAGVGEELFQFTKAGTDSKTDFNSYFFVFKYLAGSENSDFISIEKDTGISLNKAHGMKPAGSGWNQYLVKSVMNEGKMVPLANYNELFLALWLDANKDQFVDQVELLWVKATIN